MAFQAICLLSSHRLGHGLSVIQRIFIKCGGLIWLEIL
jgi:hypothetical protein